MTRGVPRAVKLVYLVLLANGLPALVLLTFAPGHTDDLFVWTVKPEASAHLLAVMYGNALLLVVLGLRAGDWAHARVTVVLITVFSVLATIETLVRLDPFLEHPWYHLGFWLSMYVLLVLAAPAVLVTQERRHGGRLPVEAPLTGAQRACAAASVAVLGAAGAIGLLAPGTAADLWPWPLTPLVAGICGVWLVALATAFAWALWDGDRARTAPIFVQGLPTGALLALLPLVHSDQVDGPVGWYLAIAAVLALDGAAGVRRAV